MNLLAPIFELQCNRDGEAAWRLGMAGHIFRACTPDKANLAKVVRRKHWSADDTPRQRRDSVWPISIFIKNQLFPEDSSEAQLKNQEIQLMSQHHAPCLVWRRSEDHESHMQPTPGWKPRPGPRYFLAYTRAQASPAYCLLVVNFMPQR